MFVPSFIEITPISKGISDHATYILTDGHTTGKHYASAAYCWRMYNKLTNSYRPTEKDGQMARWAANGDCLFHDRLRVLSGTLNSRSLTLAHNTS